MTEMPSLPSWDWKRRYESPPDDLIESFYEPAFARSNAYDRAVGFFSSALLARIAPSIDDFVSRGGMMRLITSPANLSDADLLAMGKGEKARAKLQEDLCEAASKPVPSQLLTDRLQLLTWMIGAGRLEVKIALRELDKSYALFHEKIGVFVDVDDNWMTFTGSPNETSAAASKHSESFPLHRSWLSPDQREYARDERNRVNDLWEGNIDGIALWSADQWIREPMRKLFGEREPSGSTMVPKPAPIEEPKDSGCITVNSLPLLPALPHDLELRGYQKDAINAWLEATPNGRGIFAMATGVGKTITAMASATQLVRLVEQNNRPLLVVVVVPLVDLVQQWKRDAEWFGWHPAVWHGSSKKSERNYALEIFNAARAGIGRSAEMLITTAASLTPRQTENGPDMDHVLQQQIAKHKGYFLFIGDELHSLGTKARLAALPQNAGYRLGLSATPKRHGDEEGTEALVDYFGEPVVSIGIKEAIYDHKALVEYVYEPHRIELTPDETIEYRKLSARIAAAYAKGDDQLLESLIRLRVRLSQHAAGKLDLLRELLHDGLAAMDGQLVYVAEGKSSDTDAKQLDEVERILRDEFNMAVGRYYGETPAHEREVLLRQLASGEIQALIAMKCLDEGVDIPCARIGVIMASTQNPRQFVQRRGRILRRDPASSKTHAVIYDFIVMPPASADATKSEKTLIGSELGRAVELADAARNSEVRYTLIEWAYAYDLDPDQFGWMKLNEQDEMATWTR
jgi:superfamily II DNA or RNA helicase